MPSRAFIDSDEKSSRPTKAGYLCLNALTHLLILTHASSSYGIPSVGLNALTGIY